MESKENKNITKNGNKFVAKSNITSKTIILFISVISLFIQSILILISGLKKGFVKKEILSRKTNLGFDLIIKRK